MANENTLNCPECGENKFYLDEAICYSASFDENGVLQVGSNKNNEITAIVCENCNYELTPEAIENTECNFN